MVKNIWKSVFIKCSVFQVAQRDLGLEPADVAKTQQKTGRPMSPEIKAGVEQKSDDEGLETAKSRTGDVDLDLSHSTRMERVRRKLNSVLVSIMMLSLSL